jgi:hypothetical protein
MQGLRVEIHRPLVHVATTDRQSAHGHFKDGHYSHYEFPSAPITKFDAVVESRPTSEGLLRCDERTAAWCSPHRFALTNSQGANRTYCEGHAMGRMSIRDGSGATLHRTRGSRSGACASLPALWSSRDRAPESDHDTILQYFAR